MEDLDLQNKLTPDFWHKEYNIPLKIKPVKRDLFNTAKKLSKSPVKMEKPSSPLPLTSKPTFSCHYCSFDTEDPNTLECHFNEFHSEEEDPNLLFGLDTTQLPVIDSIEGNIQMDSSNPMSFLDNLLEEVDVANVPSPPSFTTSMFNPRPDLTAAFL